MKKKIAMVIVALFALAFAVFWWVCHRDWFKFFEAAKNIAEIIAIGIGGAWALYLFMIQRQSEPAIGIKVDYKCVPNGSELYLTYFDVAFSNIGKVRIQGRKARNPAYPIESKDHDDEEETLKYGGSLLLRSIPANLPENTILDWFNQESGKPGEKLKELFFDKPEIEADLLYDYAIKDKKMEITDFWMEPGETYDVGACIALRPGNYLAIITFLGEKSDDELWRRKAIIQVPKGKTSDVSME